MKRSTLVEVARAQAERRPGTVAFTFSDGERDVASRTYAELDRDARAVGAALAARGLSGERAVLLYPPGLDFIVAFLGCLYAGVVAVPVYPPEPSRLARTLPRLLGILADCRPAAALSDSGTLGLLSALPGAEGLTWLATDTVAESPDWEPRTPDEDAFAFLQYTSGSTGAPRGVRVSHRNLVHNIAALERWFGTHVPPRLMLWLPTYHDMGLVGGVLTNLYSGGTATLMSPLQFLQRPLRWLHEITRVRATASGGPNFAYDLCVRRYTPEAARGLDLSTWGVAFNGAEPVRAETIRAFARVFADHGFREESFVSCYGLAEATLMVSGDPPPRPPTVRRYDVEALARGRAVEPREGEAGRALVSCGQGAPDQDLAIVDPVRRERLGEGEIGEIWVCGPSVATGYWRRPDASNFGAQLADGSGPFLITGDLGFLLDAQLFVCGRIKDLLVVRGRNHHPSDIERTTEASHAAVRRGGVAAFGVDRSGEELLVVVAEVDPGAEASEVAACIRRAVTEEHDLRPHDVVLVAYGTVLKTSSGKVQRHACREAYLARGILAQ